MKLYEAINKASHDWYFETGIAPTRVILHPTNYSELLEEISSKFEHSYQSPNSGMNCRTLTIATSVSTLEVMVAAQEVVDEFVLSDGKHNMKRVAFVEGGTQTVTDTPKVLIVKRSKLFLKRDAQGKYLQDLNSAWSERLLIEVSEAYDSIIVFHDTFGYRDGLRIWPSVGLKTKLINLRLQNVTVVDYDSRKSLEAVQTWKERILSVGGRIKRVSNPKIINCFDVQGLTIGNHIIWVDESGDFSKGIVVEKAQSFMELAKDRESRSNW